MKDMLGREEAVPLEKAKGLLLRSMDFHLPEEIETEIEDSLGRILSRDIISPEDLPAFPRSIVDGFALKSEDTFGAGEIVPVYLNVTHEILMGEEPTFELKKGESAKIQTGGMLPYGADGVLMFEHCHTVTEKVIEVLKPVASGENVIQVGEDIRKGDTVLEKGHRLRPQDIGALAGLGITRIWVYERPNVAIISTGDEIVHPGSPLMLGQVRDINSYNLAGLIKECGGIPIKKGIFPDDYVVLKNVLEESLRESDIIVISGGSSVGTKDLTARLINDLGKPGVLFHGVSIKPGKPMIGAIVNGKPIFGLPGHPHAVTTCFELFIAPLLRMLTGERDRLSRKIRRKVKARLSRNISSGSGRQEYIRVALEERDGELWAVPILGKSALITTLLKAEGTIVIPLGKSGLEQGTEVEVELF